MRKIYYETHIDVVCIDVIRPLLQVHPCGVICKSHTLHYCYIIETKTYMPRCPCICS